MIKYLKRIFQISPYLKINLITLNLIWIMNIDSKIYYLYFLIINF